MDFVFPCEDDRIIATPLHVFRDCLRLGVVFAAFVLKVTSDDPHFAVFRVQTDIETIGRHSYVLERSIWEYSILSLSSVDDVYSISNSKKDLHGSGKRVSWWDDTPRMYLFRRRYREKSRSRFLVMRDSNEMVVRKDSDKS